MLLVCSFASFFFVVAKFRLLQVGFHSLWIILGSFFLGERSFQIIFNLLQIFSDSCRSFQVVSCSLQVISHHCRLFQVDPRFNKYSNIHICKMHIQQNLFKTTTFGTTQKWSSLAGGRLIKHLYETATKKMWSSLAGFQFFFPR